jgi:hypothetical protein
MGKGATPLPRPSRGDAHRRPCRPPAPGLHRFQRRLARRLIDNESHDEVGNTDDRIARRGRCQPLANPGWPAFDLARYPEKTRGGATAHDITDLPIPAYGAVVVVRWD